MNRRLWPSLLAVISVGVVVVGVFPTRTWMAQRESVKAEEARVAVLSTENARLAARVDELHTDAEVERLAREQYNMVRPGEEAYAILPAPETAAGRGDEASPGPAGAAAPTPIANVRSEADHRPAWRKVVDLLTFWD